MSDLPDELPADFEIVTKGEALRRYPAIKESFEWWNDESDDERLLLFKGSRHILPAWRALLKLHEAEGFVIDGDVELAWDWMPTLWCTGRLRGDCLSLTKWSVAALGGIKAERYVELYAIDNAFSRKPPGMRVDTPYVFAWFYRLDSLDLRPDTTVFIHLDPDELPSNPAYRQFAWHESIHALRDDLQDEIQHDDVEDLSYSQTCWDMNAISSALQRGESIWREGFDPEALDLCAEAAGELARGERKRSWRLYRRAAELAPAYYPAALMLGRLLYEEGAFRQALPYLRRAVTLFPTCQPKFHCEAVFYAAMAALRLDQARLALTVLEDAQSRFGDKSTFGVDPHPDALWATGEAYWLLSQPDHPEYRPEESEEALDEADDDGYVSHERWEASYAIDRVEAHPDHAALNWLKGMMLYQRGELAEAESYRRKAAEISRQFEVGYDRHRSTAFLTPSATEVDWEEISLQASQSDQA